MASQLFVDLYDCDKDVINNMDRIKSIAKEYNQTIVMVTHDSRIAAFADKVINIYDGCIASVEEKENI